MDLDAYLAAVSELAEICHRNEVAPQEHLDSGFQQGDKAVQELIGCRKSWMTADDEERVASFAGLGCFLAMPASERPAAFALCLDVSRELDVVSLQARCARYDEHRPIFANVPSLRELARDDELIDYRRLTHNLEDGEVVSFEGSWALLDPGLHSSVPLWCRQLFPDSEIYVRLRPDRVFSSRPMPQLLEAVIRPPNPRWWESLSLPLGVRDGAAFCLSPNRTLPTYDRDMWDSVARRIRRLEVSARRDEAQHLTLMAEELAEPYAGNAILLGRCLHLDTAAPVGTAFTQADLLHLDLAINVYLGQDIAARLGHSLAQGKVQDATCRTHLFRIDPVPAPALFFFAMAFFVSRTLAMEWLDSQFPRWRDTLDQAQ